MINIDILIKNATLSKNKVALNAYKNIKSEFEKFKYAQKLPRSIDSETQLRIIGTYARKLEDSIFQFSQACRDDLVSEYSSELEVVKKLLPEPVNERQIKNFLEGWCIKNNFIETYLDNGAPCPMEGYDLKIPKKEMGNAIKFLKSAFPTADGKMISEIVKKYIV